MCMVRVKKKFHQARLVVGWGNFPWNKQRVRETSGAGALACRQRNVCLPARIAEEKRGREGMWQVASGPRSMCVCAPLLDMLHADSSQAQYTVHHEVSGPVGHAGVAVARAVCSDWV